MREQLNWIRPGYRKPEVKRCEYCHADVSTPYKGIHDETEIISGLPVRCRNNGKANIHLAHGYPVGDQPNPSIKYFVEHTETHLWWTGYQWTNDPNQAFACEFEWSADRYARFQKLENYTITEHEFVNPRI